MATLNQFLTVPKSVPAEITLIRTGDLEPFAVNVPSAFTIDPGNEEVVTTTPDKISVLQYAVIYLSQSLSRVQFSMSSGRENPIVLEFLFGQRYINDANATVTWPDIFTPGVNNTTIDGNGNLSRAAATSGFRRFGLAADVANASTFTCPAAGFPNKQSVPLTHIPFATAQVSTLNDFEYAQGPDGANLYAANLLNLTVVQVAPQLNVPVIRRGSLSSGTWRMIVQITDSEDRAETFDFGVVQPVLTGRTYSPGADTWDLEMYVRPAAGTLSFDHFLTDLIAENA